MGEGGRGNSCLIIHFVYFLDATDVSLVSVIDSEKSSKKCVFTLLMNVYAKNVTIFYEASKQNIIQNLYFAQLYLLWHISQFPPSLVTICVKIKPRHSPGFCCSTFSHKNAKLNFLAKV